MYKGRRVILIAPAYNEEVKIAEVVRRAPRDIIDTVLVVDDGSTDGTASAARDKGAVVISLGAVLGVGAAIRTGFDKAKAEGFDIAVVIAGNNKDAPEEITRLLDPICDDNMDFVMGSRWREGGRHGGDMPFYRKIATRLHPMLVGFFCGKRITESTNGYRAMKVSVLDDKRIDLRQAWLDRYELEVYLLMKVLRLGYRCTEVPVSKIYPPKAIGNTKMKPGIDWWRMLRPIFLIGLGLRK
ncbi:Glycosyltransferase [Paramagnetospirillum magnetotacticum MS-1]|uniref:Glycosyltransferase n=1 Tax=Paramagnetospirillum magnetotacticum MS-1 TaxID=272627 RepID=A0A0C2UYB8_PARME|nr:glycosyltransferase family 2 protein [Paramagnetospirillum magnetotacticum]KIL97801.1 Glycosyltransferase [Paramagnetospirillum magnetotacticum MS-1]